MEKRSNQNLTSSNTFGLPSKARLYSVITSENDLIGVTKADNPFVLGGGSNILLPTFLDRWVLHNDINFIDANATDQNEVLIEVGAGVNWHHLVTTCVKMNWAGLENLALIPGRVGAAPVQNIGAYGVELKDVFVSLKAYDLHDEKIVELDRVACQFGYRNSLFKSTEKGRYIITSIKLKLHQNSNDVNLDYYALKEECRARGLSSPSLQDVFDMVVDIRSRKLPNPAQLGNSGSFFKNPVINRDIFEKLQSKFPDIKYFEADDKIKIPAGYLIEKCGWKGKRIGNTGCYEKQALVIVNYGGATSEEVVRLVEDIKISVHDQYGLMLQEEVNIVN